MLIALIGVILHLRQCTVANVTLSGVLVDRGAIGIIDDCDIRKCGQNGVFFYVSNRFCFGLLFVSLTDA